MENKTIKLDSDATNFKITNQSFQIHCADNLRTKFYRTMCYNKKLFYAQHSPGPYWNVLFFNKSAINTFVDFYCVKQQKSLFFQGGSDENFTVLLSEPLQKCLKPSNFTQRSFHKYVFTHITRK